MLKNMKLAAKIAFGFATVLLLAIILGSLSIINMNNVMTNTNKLKNEYVPEVDISNNVEREAMLTMYEIRGYAFKGDDAYLTAGLDHIKNLKEYLDDARTLSEDYSDLVVLQKSVEEASVKVEEYEILIEDTIDKNSNIASERSNQDNAASDFINNCWLYLAEQNNSFLADIANSAESNTLKERLDKINLINTVIDLGNDVRINNFKAQTTGDLTIIQEALKNFDQIDANILMIKAITHQQVNLDRLDKISDAGLKYKKSVLALIDLLKESDVISSSRTTTGNLVLDSAKSIALAGIGQTQTVADIAAATLTASSTVMVFGLIFAIIIGILLSIVIITSITRPIGRISSALNEGSQQVAAASEQLSSSSQQLAEGSSEQASSLEETSSTLEESSSMVRQNTENTRQAASLSKQAKDAAEKGNIEVQTMMASMEELKKSSDKIAKIIKVIDDIAFQTNILALNAAVEAARAGDAGMGFAVVAEEVRNLAQRSAQAAKDTAQIIEDNIELSSKGVDISVKVKQSLFDINNQAQKVNELLDEVAAASIEQSQGINQINRAIAQMEQVVQSNAANAEESASASEELSAQAINLKDIVNQLVHLVNGKTTAGKESDVFAHNNSHILHSSVQKNLNANELKTIAPSKPVKKDTKIIKPEDVIPLEKDIDEF